jgi:hypothetical protein
MKLLTTALALALGLTTGAASAEQKSSDGLMTIITGGYAIKSCTDKIRDRLAIGAGKTLNIEHMNADAPPSPGVWDMRFKGSATITATKKTTAISGVCHVRPDKPTTVELTAG